MGKAAVAAGVISDMPPAGKRASYDVCFLVAVDLLLLLPPLLLSEAFDDFEPVSVALVVMEWELVSFESEEVAVDFGVDLVSEAVVESEPGFGQSVFTPLLPRDATYPHQPDVRSESRPQEETSAMARRLRMSRGEGGRSRRRGM